jgi:isoamyl acetate esterase
MIVSTWVELLKSSFFSILLIFSATSMSARPKILLLGDSLTQLGWDGWAGQIAHVYQRRADVVNRGMAGYNTKWFLEYSNRSDVWQQGSVKLIIIFFGANDSSDKILNPRHHIPLEDFKENVKKLIELSKKHYGEEVEFLLVTAPPVVHHQRLIFQKEMFGDNATGLLERNMDLSKLYAQGMTDVGEENNIPVVDLWNYMQEHEQWDSFFYDGLHFTSSGNQCVARAILEKIKTAYPNLTVTACPATQQWANSASTCSDIPHDGPYHNEIDHENHEAAFDAHGKKLM